MEKPYWYRQEPGKPLFPDLLWSRPENRQMAGKLLIVGGNLHGFAAPADAYREAMKAGIGAARVLLPDALRKTVGPVLEAGEFAPSTPSSGSFSQKALDEWLFQSSWADGTLLAGDLGRNAETAILLEKFLTKFPGQIILTKDAGDYLSTTAQAVGHRPQTLLVLSLAQLQRFAIALKYSEPITFSLDLLRLVDWLHKFTAAYAPHIIVKHLDTIFVAVGGQVSTTKLREDLPIWRLKTAAHAAVWWVQNAERPFEALTTALLDQE